MDRNREPFINRLKARGYGSARMMYEIGKLQKVRQYKALAVAEDDVLDRVLSLVSP